MPNNIFLSEWSAAPYKTFMKKVYYLLESVNTSWLINKYFLNNLAEKEILAKISQQNTALMARLGPTNCDGKILVCLETIFNREQ